MWVKINDSSHVPGTKVLNTKGRKPVLRPFLYPLLIIIILALIWCSVPQPTPKKTPQALNQQVIYDCLCLLVMNSPYISELQKCHGEFLTAFPKPHVAPYTICNRESCHLCYLIYSYPNPTPYHPKVFPHYIGINQLPRVTYR